MNLKSILRLFVCLSLITVTSEVRADDPGSSVTFELGGAYGQLDVAGNTADVSGGAAGVKWELGKLLMADLGLRADYRHLESSGSTSFQRDDSDVDLRFSVGLLGILNPYVSAGVSYDRNQSPGYTPDNDWALGYAAGAGVGITLLPGLLHTTPSARYVVSDDLDTITYTLDTALHFTVVGVGLRLDYEDNLSRDAHLFTGVLYVALRF